MQEAFEVILLLVSALFGLAHANDVPAPALGAPGLGAEVAVVNPAVAVAIFNLSKKLSLGYMYKINRISTYIPKNIKVNIYAY